MDRTDGPNLSRIFFWEKKTARADHAALLAAYEGWKFSPNAQKKNIGKEAARSCHWARADRAALLPSRTRRDGLDGPVRELSLIHI